MKSEISGGQKLTQEQIRRIADLARIEIDEAEQEKYALEMSAILGYVEQLGEADTKAVEPTTHIAGINNITRQDEARPSDPDERKKIIDCAPLAEGEYIKVKSVLQ